MAVVAHVRFCLNCGGTVFHHKSPTWRGLYCVHCGSPKPAYQENAKHLELYQGHDRLKFLVGNRLHFIEYSDGVQGAFRPGDLLVVLPRNRCGMGIDVIRPDGIIDMVWPEEVT
jgi:hypothetical protein